MQITVQESSDMRLDAYLAKHLTSLSRSRIQTLIRDQFIILNGKASRPRDSLQMGDIIDIALPEEVPENPQPEAIPLHVLYEDEEIIVVDKAHNFVVHPAPGNPNGTLVNALLYHCKSKLSDLGASERPGIVHRLDKDTSGCIVAAKSNEAHVHLVDQFSNRTNTKIYLAVCEGAPKKLQDTIFTNIGRHPVSRQKMAVVSPPVGKPAITDYEVLAVCDITHTSLIRCHLHTGRTHQIRVHLHHIGCPIVADPIYGKTSTTSKQVERLMLHAWKLSITHPSSGDTIHCSAEIPHVFQPWLELCDPSSLT